MHVGKLLQKNGETGVGIVVDVGHIAKQFGRIANLIHGCKKQDNFRWCIRLFR